MRDRDFVTITSYMTSPKCSKIRTSVGEGSRSLPIILEVEHLVNDPNYIVLQKCDDL